MEQPYNGLIRLFRRRRSQLQVEAVGTQPESITQDQQTRAYSLYELVQKVEVECSLMYSSKWGHLNLRNVWLPYFQFSFRTSTRPKTAEFYVVFKQSGGDYPALLGLRCPEYLKGGRERNVQQSRVISFAPKFTTPAAGAEAGNVGWTRTVAYDDFEQEWEMSSKTGVASDGSHSHRLARWFLKASKGQNTENIPDEFRVGTIVEHGGHPIVFKVGIKGCLPSSLLGSGHSFGDESADFSPENADFSLDQQHGVDLTSIEKIMQEGGSEIHPVPAALIVRIGHHPVND